MLRQGLCVFSPWPTPVAWAFQMRLLVLALGRPCSAETARRWIVRVSELRIGVGERLIGFEAGDTSERSHPPSEMVDASG